MEMRKDGKPVSPSKMVGTVVAIREIPERVKNSPKGKWAHLLGRTVDVLWSNGKLNENFAENSLEVLEVIDES